MEMGYCMGGIEDQILWVVDDVASRFDEITYVEIGVAYGATMTAIASRLRDSGKKWRVIGIELINGYSFNRERTEAFAAKRNLKLNFVIPNGAIVHPLWETLTVYFKDSQSFLTEIWQEPIHLALIDGCHGKPCVTLDFLALEAFMVPGGTIMFHDFGIDQRGDFQPHCPTGIDVRGACESLGLLTDKRPNWKHTGTFIGDKMQGGYDMGIFEKMKGTT
jgi:hypothetical protein